MAGDNSIWSTPAGGGPAGGPFADRSSSLALLVSATVRAGGQPLSSTLRNAARRGAASRSAEHTHPVAGRRAAAEVRAIRLSSPLVASLRLRDAAAESIQSPSEQSKAAHACRLASSRLASSRLGDRFLIKSSHFERTDGPDNWKSRLLLLRLLLLASPLLFCYMRATRLGQLSRERRRERE